MIKIEHNNLKNVCSIIKLIHVQKSFCKIAKFGSLNTHFQLSSFSLAASGCGAGKLNILFPNLPCS